MACELTSGRHTHQYAGRKKRAAPLLARRQYYEYSKCAQALMGVDIRL